ncbi:hypothetical protein CBR_g41811 [Chara braunii]|uniref:Retrotransposon gag domain-containing protein n=1 Tax=Chara braunii TaxID=69332 RepID=A0A388LWP5_CHABU|nr:hypothetical protein CBR_g41811 [Chara braunii]|eukprot:GBG86747.1 hypothetical protein CBR_g41811 [Chara braunii]
MFCMHLAAGRDPMWILEDAERLTWEMGQDFANEGWDEVGSRVVMGGWEDLRLPYQLVQVRVPHFVADWFGGYEHIRAVAKSMNEVEIGFAWLSDAYYEASLRFGPFHGDQAEEVVEILKELKDYRLEVGEEVEEAILRREIAAAPSYVGDVFLLFEKSRVRSGSREREMARRMTLWETRPRGILSPSFLDRRVEVSLPSRGGVYNPVMDWVGEELVEDTVYLVVELEWRARGEFGGTNLELPGRVRATGSLYLSEAGWRTFGVALADGGDPVRMFDGAWQVTWREGFAFANPDQDDVTTTVRVVEDLGQGSQDGDAQHRKDRPRDTRDTPTRKGKEGIEFLREDRDRPVNPPLLDSGASRPSASPVSVRGCEGLWSLRERVLGWFDPEGIAKPKGQLDFSKEGAGPSSMTGPGMIEGGLRKVVLSLTRALSKNQEYLADAKKKLTFDGGNITKFLIGYENLAALLRWTEEEKMEHLGQHVSLNLGRDIMAIVATSGSWKEARDVMMRKYLADEKMATEAELATVQRKNFATYSDFLREFTLVALRIPGVTDRIMSKYFLKQFTEFDKDKILSAYQQTAKFLNTRDVDFSTITDIAEKMVVTDSLALLKEGEIIDLTGKTGDKVKKGIESLHERVYGVDGKIERVENALLVMQAQVSQTQAVRPPLPPQEAIVPPGIANRGNNRKDPANEQCKYCTIVGHFVCMCPRLNHDIILKRCFRTLRGEILGPRGERVNWNSLGGMRRAVIALNNLDAAAVEAEPVEELTWGQAPGRGHQVNFITESDDRDGVNVTTRQRGATKKVIQDAVMAHAQEGSNPPAESDQDKVYGKPREEAPVDKVTSAKKKFRYQIPILADPEIDHTLSQLVARDHGIGFLPDHVAG